MRTSDARPYNYFYAGGKLMRQTDGTNTLDFFYDESGHPYALKYNGTTYYYVTNLQGDVLHIVNNAGTAVVSYTYDPYGKVLSATGALAEINPLRYRGYVYDTETGFYYLQSRYYDPTICRFINADSYASTGQGFLGYNMFAYCRNNPVYRKDTTGTLDECTKDSTDDNIPFNDVGGIFYHGSGGIGKVFSSSNANTVSVGSLVGVLFAEVLALFASHKKPVNLPSPKKVKLDIDHITSGHTPDGNRNPKGNKTVFWGLTAEQIMRAVYEAYSNASKLKTQGIRIKLMGYSDTFQIAIEMWLNIAEMIIETAYPK